MKRSELKKIVGDVIIESANSNLVEDALYEALEEFGIKHETSWYTGGGVAMNLLLY